MITLHIGCLSFFPNSPAHSFSSHKGNIVVEEKWLIAETSQSSWFELGMISRLRPPWWLALVLIGFVAVIWGFSGVPPTECRCKLPEQICDPSPFPAYCGMLAVTIINDVVMLY